MFFDGFFDNLDGMVEVPDAPKEIFQTYVPDYEGFFRAYSLYPFPLHQYDELSDCIVASEGHKKAATMICKGKLKRTKQMYRPQFEYLASILPKDEVKNAKITLAAPEWYHLRRMLDSS
jgi:hypothetical protein